MAKLEKLGVLSTAKALGIVMAGVGLMAGITYSFGGAFYELITGTLNSGTVLAFGALLGMPLIFASFGFITGAVGSFLYNLAAKWVGGIEVELDEEA